MGLFVLVYNLILSLSAFFSPCLTRLECVSRFHLTVLIGLVLWPNGCILQLICIDLVYGRGGYSPSAWSFRAACTVFQGWPRCWSLAVGLSGTSCVARVLVGIPCFFTRLFIGVASYAFIKASWGRCETWIKMSGQVQALHKPRPHTCHLTTQPFSPIAQSNMMSVSACRYSLLDIAIFGHHISLLR